MKSDKPYPFNTREPARYSQGKFYLPYDFVDGRKLSGIAVAEKWAERQTHGGRIRPDGCPFPHRYKGSQWFSVTRNAVEELLRFTDNRPASLLSLRYTFAPEEIYVPTVLVGLLPGETIANENLRYVRWKMENHSNPANLGIEHFGELSKSTAFFARKMQLAERAKLFGERIPQEKVYVQMDNTCYFLGDTIWFSVFTRRTNSGRPRKISRVLYAELWNPDLNLTGRARRTSPSTTTANAHRYR